MLTERHPRAITGRVENYTCHLALQNLTQNLKATATALNIGNHDFLFSIKRHNKCINKAFIDAHLH